MRASSLVRAGSCSKSSSLSSHFGGGDTRLGYEGGGTWVIGDHIPGWKVVERMRWRRLQWKKAKKVDVLC